MRVKFPVMKAQVLLILSTAAISLAAKAAAGHVEPSRLPILALLENITVASNTSEVPLGSTTDCEDRTVSWQSACWTLVALALNAMTQSSAADHVITASALSPARSSPFICLADILVTLIWTMAGCIIGAPLSTTPALASYHLKVDREDPFKELQKGIPSVGITFFVLGPLPQAVKMWGMCGLPLTQTIGSVYMTVYLLTILTSLCLAPKEDRRLPLRTIKWVDPPTLLRLSQGIYFAAFAAQVVVWIYIFFRVAGYFVSQGVAITFAVLILMNLIPFLLCMAEKPIIILLGRVFLAIPYSILVIMLFDIYVVRAGNDDGDDMLLEVLGYICMGYLYTAEWILILPCIFIVVAICSGLIYFADITIKFLATAISDSAEPDAGPDAETNLMTSVAQHDPELDAERGIQISSKTFSVANTTQHDPESVSGPSHHTSSQLPRIKSSSKSKQQYGHQYWSIAFAVTNLVCAFLCYGYLYDPKNTQKPAWTDMLG